MAQQFQVIAYRKDGSFQVLPVCGKTVPKKEAQRLASSVMGFMDIDPEKVACTGKTETQIIKTHVVEIALVANLSE